MMSLEQRHSQSLKQLQRLLMSRQMQQAIHILQLPIMELSGAIQTEVEQNPVLEYLEETPLLEEEAPPETPILPEQELSFENQTFNEANQLQEDWNEFYLDKIGYRKTRTTDEEKKLTYWENSLVSKPSLFEYLMQQAEETFAEEEDRKIAEVIIGNLNDSGFLTTPLSEISKTNQFPQKKLQEILAEIQTFDPKGIAAESLQQSLLIQLRLLNKTHSLSYQILEDHFDDLIHHRIPLLQKKLHCSADEIESSLDEISKLDLHPGAQFAQQIPQQIIPDITLRLEGDNLITEIYEDTLPPLRLRGRYLKMLNDPSLPKETQDFIRQKVSSAKWLMRNLMQRNETLINLVKFLAEHQRDFFIKPDGKLTPLNMKTVAEDLNVHESTIARAVSRKYLYCPRGLLPLRSFFTSSLQTEAGNEVSSSMVREMIAEWLKNEDKAHPLTDQELSEKMKEKGIQCARRTIAKYRMEMNLGNAQQRKRYTQIN